MDVFSSPLRPPPALGNNEEPPAPPLGNNEESPAAALGNNEEPPPVTRIQGIVTHPSEDGEPSKSSARAPAKVKQAEESEDSRVVTWILRRTWQSKVVKKADVAARFVEAALCLISFAVMAADRERGWAVDSFNFYKEYRYCLSVNVIGFAYAVFQLLEEVQHLSTKKHIVPLSMRNYFKFSVDQVMAYLLLSASSSATARTKYWVMNWGYDPFPNIISASVVVSFIAFLAFALSSIMSAYNLFNQSI